MFTRFADPNYWLLLLYSLPAVLFAISVHEYSHAFAAYKCGDSTARNLGRMTLDPSKHLDLWGTLCLVLFRFGWAKPVPINTRNFKNFKRDNVMVSLAGIISNFIMSFVFYSIFTLVIVFGFHGNAMDANSIVYLTSAGMFLGTGNMPLEIFANILVPLTLLNITFGIFNLLPIPPLDGFALISGFISRKHANVVNFLYRYGFIILIVLIFVGFTSFVLGGFANWLLGVYGSFYSAILPVF